MNEFYVAHTHKTDAVLAECQESGRAMMEQKVPSNLQNCIMNDFEQLPDVIRNFLQPSFSIRKKAPPDTGWQLRNVHRGSEILLERRHFILCDFRTGSFQHSAKIPSESASACCVTHYTTAHRKHA